MHTRHVNRLKRAELENRVRSDLAIERKQIDREEKLFVSSNYLFKLLPTLNLQPFLTLVRNSKLKRS